MYHFISYIFSSFLTKFLFLSFAYLRVPYVTSIALAAFLKESNVVGSISSEEITNVHRLKTKFSF